MGSCAPAYIKYTAVEGHQKSVKASCGHTSGLTGSAKGLDGWRTPVYETIYVNTTSLKKF